MQIDTLILDRRPAVLARRGDKNTSLFRDQKAGLWTEPLHVGRAAMWPRHEVDALIAARIAGKSDVEIKALVRQLMAARKTIADRYFAKLQDAA